MIPRVFIPHIAMKENGNKLVPVFDFSQAQQFGQITPVLDADDNPMFISRLTHKIKNVLEGFSAEDYLLCVGDPAVIALCSGLILRRQMALKLLKWDRSMKTYIQVEVKI
ncbi:hypothetical protein PLUTO_00880 [Luteibacter phage vB_LflM-Pluto]|uniref:Uncharacterized protein n=1 Tax=Luteibacter phage vB_LflM-Pluto TaxID=2948611 RepID=A0A9E7SM98_9CAUD|nr:hypothetical protein PLUTO_00880 [Luteibacter phage vB_LflM-Pluto]